MTALCRAVNVINKVTTSTFLKQIQNTVVYLVVAPCNISHIEPAGGTVFTGVRREETVHLINFQFRKDTNAFP